MKTYDIFGYSFSAIRLRKLRAALTTLGVVIGIAAIVALLSITQGLQTTITGSLNRGLSATTLIVVPGSNALGGIGSSGSTTSGGTSGFGGRGSGGPGGGISLGGSSASSSGFALYINYTSQIDALSPDINSSTAVIQRTGYINTGTVSEAVSIYGVNYGEYSNQYPTTFVAGSGTIPTSPSDNQIVVGTRIVDPRENGTTLFSAGNNVEIDWTNASTLQIVNETYIANVAGVLQKVGGFGATGPSDSGIYMPLSKAENFFGTDQCDYIIVQLKNSNNATINNVTKAITDHFSGQVTVISSTAVLSLLSTIFGTIQFFLGGIAAISLIVAGVGIMNIMIVSLIERTREIGILKALGMKSRTVLMIFLGESVIVGVIGAIGGIILGWVVANVTTGILASGLFGGSGFQVTPLLTPEVFVGALGFGVGVSVIFALYPAWRASKLKPVEALRYE